MADNEIDLHTDALTKERVEQARRRMGKPQEAAERPSWVSLMLVGLCTLVMGSPRSHEQQRDFYLLPFERTKQLPQPDEIEFNLIRNNLYFNAYRRAWFKALAVPVGIYLALVVFAAPYAVNKTKEKVKEIKAASIKERNDNIAALLKSWQPADVVNCEAAVDDTNDILADKNKIRLKNEEIERKISEQIAKNKQPSSVKQVEDTVLEDASEKEAAHYQHIQYACLPQNLVEIVPTTNKDDPQQVRISTRAPGQ